MKIRIFTILIFVAMAMCVFAGFIFGMISQQKAIEASIINILTYSDLDIDINFNETKFIEEFNKTILPTIIEKTTQNSTKEKYK